MKALLAAASVAALLSAAPAWAQTAANSAAVGTEQLSQQDRTFVEKAGGGSLAEADLGRLAIEKGATPTVREFGRWMYTDHDLVANNWLRAIMADEHQSFQLMLTAQDRDLQQRLQDLSGREFDQQYIDAQVTAHEQTIPVFEREAREGSNPIIKNFARGLVPVLRQHLAEAKELAGTVGIATTGSTAERSGSSMPPR